MKIFAGMMVLSLAVPMMAQRVTPPAVPNAGAAQPQPGIASGASGGVGISATGRTPGVGPTVPGRPTFGPPPVLMTPDQLVPPYPYPLFPPGLLAPYPYEDLPPQPPVGRGRPGGLGVTITGGDSNPLPPPTPPPTTPTTAVTNLPPAVTNPPPTNPTNGTITNTAPPLQPYSR